jgi:hypothetical protein
METSELQKAVNDRMYNLARQVYEDYDAEMLDILSRSGPTLPERVPRKLFGFIPLGKKWVEVPNPYYDPSKTQLCDLVVPPHGIRHWMGGGE